MKLWALAAVLGVAAMLSPATADTITGNQLLQWCEANDNNPERAMCLGYVLAMIDAFEATKVICPPKAVTYAQVTDTITKFLRDNPTRRHLPALALASDALHPPFACPKN